MKSPLEKWRSIGLNKGITKGKLDHKYPLPVDGLNQAAKDMKEMRTCYDSLLSAAAATANSAYEFSESLLEMGNCLLEKTAVHDDGESRGALSMLGKVQLELQKLVDIYRSHIIMTITNPSECLLSELRKVEEMKLQCDEKRDVYEHMVGQFREKGKSRHGKGETFSSQLKVVCDEYDDAAKLCIFRVESLKQGQSRSLLAQATRHHAAQLDFFRKGFQSLGAIEPHIRSVAEKQHIDYEVSELNEVQKDDDEISFDGNDYGEISFDFRNDEMELQNPGTSGNSMELDQFNASSAQTSKVKDVDTQIDSTKNQGDRHRTLSQKNRGGSYSAPIYPEKYDVADKIRETRTSTPKLNTHVLLTPAVAMGSMGTTSTPMPPTLLPLSSSKNLWHSSPLDIEKPKKYQIPPPPLTEGAASGPLGSKPSFNKPLLPTSGPVEPTQTMSGLLRPPLLNVSQNISPSPATSPKISELHELPRPPNSFSFKPRHSFGTLGHSAPLAPVVSRNREVSPTNRNPFMISKEGSPLPLPKLTVSKSFSIPSSSERVAAPGEISDTSQILENTKEVASPPLSPISLSNMKSPNSGKIRVYAGGR